jgi:PAS domain S-box-containing protein
LIILNFNKYKIIISGIVLGVLFWIIEAIMDTLVFYSKGDLIHHLFFIDAHELWMRSIVILFLEALSVYSQIIFNKVKTNEQKLKGSEEKYKLITENANDLIAVLNKKFEHEYINEKTYQKILGYSNEDMLGKTRHDIIHPADTKKAFKVLRDGFKKGEGAGELRLRHKNGKYIWIETKGRTFKGSDGLLKAITVSRNITDRKKAEKEIQLERDNLINILSSMEDGVYIVDKNYDIEYVNPILIQEFGQYEGKKCYKYFHDRNESCPWCKNQEVFEGKTVRWEWYSFKNQKTYDLIDTPLKNVDGSVSKLEIFHDISERKQIELDLKSKQAALESIFKATPTGIGVVVNRVIKQVNDQFCELVGYTREELLNKSARMVYPTDEDYEFVGKEKYAQIDSSGSGSVETRFKRKDGKIINVILSSALMDPDQPSAGATFTALDITERKIAEQKLKESEVKYRHLFETSPYFIGLVNSEGILIDSNDAINDILSIHTIEGVIGKSFKEIFLLNEKSTHLIPIFEKFIKSIFEGVNQEGFDFRLNRSIGDHIWIHIEGTLIEIEEQKLIQFIMQDITERKRSEQLLRESIEELARSNTELEQFTYVASHDLKEPLRMISSFTQLLERRYKDKLDEEANDFIRFITEGVVRMQDLINSLLAYSRIGKNYKEFEKVDLDDVLKDVIDNLKQIINETNAEVIYDSLTLPLFIFHQDLIINIGFFLFAIMG